jgi:hypothetical protein
MLRRKSSGTGFIFTGLFISLYEVPLLKHRRVSKTATAGDVTLRDLGNVETTGIHARRMQCSNA